MGELIYSIYIGIVLIVCGIVLIKVMNKEEQAIAQMSQSNPTVTNKAN